MKIILFNGPPSSGKDFATRACMFHFARTHSVRWERFSRPNKHAFAGMIDAQISKWSSHPGDAPDMVAYYEAHKEEPIPWLGVSYRQWQIDFSECFMKSLYGPDIFARLFLERNRVRLAEPGWLCFVSDCGFQIEYDTVVASLDPKDVLLIRLEREGCDFSKDSREYVEPSYEHHHYRLINNGGPDYAGDPKYDFTTCVIQTVEEWLR